VNLEIAWWCQGFARNDGKKEHIQMAKKNRRTNHSERGIFPSRSEFNPDYSDVKKDLTRIGTLAGSSSSC
jgi:hypothetical protein